MFMSLALELAQDAYQKGEVPVGAVIVDSATGKVIASTHNLAEKNQDPTAHAEMLAIREACKYRGTVRLPECDMYVTLEPCPMCATAISFSRIRRLYFGAYDVKGGGVENGPRVFSQSTCHHKPDVFGGISESESAALLKKFFAEMR